MCNCYLCGSSRHHNRDGIVRDKPELNILECDDCGLVFLSGTAESSEMFYEESGMHGDEPLDVSRWLRENAQDDQRRFELLQTKLVGRSILDFGCGAGGFILKARHLTDKIAGVELERRLVEHYADNNLNVYDNLDSVPKDEFYDLITAFHVVEHLSEPRKILRELAEHLTPEGQMLIEVPSSEDALLSLYANRKFSEFTYWSCHLYLFSPSTLSELAKQAGLKVNFIKQVQRYPLSNHLYWLAKGKPGGHDVWSFLDNPILTKEYESVLASVGACDTLLASFSIL